MIFFRSLLFHICWFANIILQMIFYLPIVYFLSRQTIYKKIRLWIKVNNFFHNILCNTKIEITGTQNIPKGGCIIAAKHQSIWEFYGLIEALPDPCFVLKYELTKIPCFSIYIKRTKHIAIKRQWGGFALRKIIANAKIALAENRQIVIFVEGTRTKPDDEPNYQQGIIKMYQDLNCPIVPLALNSGLYWGKHSFWRYGGTIRAKFLPPIKQDLDKNQFITTLENTLENACNELYKKASEDKNPPPISAKLQARIDGTN